MKTNKITWFLLLTGIVILAAGCESYSYDKQAGTLSPSFPPAPATSQNSPDAHKGG